ncbi:MAG: DUF3685 domain-containing protein [Synechococcaceae cyanobacterium]|nr:DUF3685 domain-containing protein [Synechococcaceae cyanobacterium]
MNRAPARGRPQLLLFADPLARAGLIAWLERQGDWRPVSAVADLEGAPQLVLWSLQGRPPAEALAAELQALQERWQPAPLLLLLPRGHAYPTPFLLRLPVQGLLEDPDAEALAAALSTLQQGGRTLRRESAPAGAQLDPPPPMGLGRWLLVSGLQQIDAELALCRRLLQQRPDGGLAVMLLQGRRRELEAARALLLWLWGPAWMAMGVDDTPLRALGQTTDAGPVEPAAGRPALALTLRRRDADGLWQALQERLEQVVAAGPSNRSGQLLALDGLRPERRRDLLQALLQQFSQLRERLVQEELKDAGLLERWQGLQPDLRREALRQLAGSYVQLPWGGELRPVADSLLQSTRLSYDDPELPDPQPMLAPLLQAAPLLVEGRLLPPDQPEALLYLEMLLANWLVRSAELIAAELLAACADWPELRRYLLQPELLATRNLERLRNQLNAQQRWGRWFQQPVRLYESRRALFRLQDGAIDCIALTEPRDRELRQLPWPQQLVTLLLETRDALAPQLQSLLRATGDLMVMLLTRGLGRAIGLVGRGIAQGMGRSLGKG